MMDTAAPEGAFKMTNVHCKLLVLISKYGQMPVADEPETWIRELPLLVLVYEGITAGVFEMDYSPQCMTMSHTGVTRRMFLNISQEAKSAIDELREQKLISALKISSEDLQSVTAFQASLYQCAHIHKKPVRVSILTRASDVGGRGSFRLICFD